MGKRFMIAALLTGILFLTGCGSNRTGNYELTVRKQFWSEGEAQKEESNRYEPVVGQIIYEGFGSSITVKDFDRDRVTLQIEDSCFIEPNADGTINLMAKPIKTLTVRSRKSKTIASQTMDGGVTLTVEYKTH